MNPLQLSFVPELPLWLSVTLSMVIVAICGYGMFRRLRGSWVRGLAGILASIALFNPAFIQEDRTPLNTIIPLVIDETTSQQLDNRDRATGKVVADIRKQIARLDNFELREIRSGDRIFQDSDISTALFRALTTATQDVPTERVGSAIFITDGQVHDVPPQLQNEGNTPPIHVLLTGRKDEKDRRIFLKNAPRYGVVGESQEIVYQIEDIGFDERERVDVTIRMDGEVVAIEQVYAGEEASFVFDVPHGGKNIIEFVADADRDEITDINNTTFTTLNGIRENLRVLLVSGEPHAGERTWRNLLKSDAAVDLVHFTILRPPEKQDGTPITQLSLIAFPTRELFVQKIDEFDLIIFDRYKRRGILPMLYFDNIARYVKDGGAVLASVGPEYSELTSIGQTPLQSVLPALANGQVNQAPYKPRLSELGQRHPVTRKLKGWDDGDPSWGRWFRSVGVERADGDTVMVDGNNDSLLVLERHNEGRVALFLSDHVWLWSRGFDGGGPDVQLLRRLAHWLMKEPQLEEERLTAEGKGEQLLIKRQTLGTKPSEVNITNPSGDQVTVELSRTSEGIWSATHTAQQIGLHRVSDDTFTALAQIGPANPRELSSVISTSRLLQPTIDATSGSMTRITDGSNVPRLIGISENGTSSGPGWIGLVNRNASLLNGINKMPLFAGFLGFSLLLLAFASVWYREGH